MKKPHTAQPQIKEPERNAVSQNDKTPFPIIGIGSSAGGLEALELFLKNIPVPSRAAFVIVQHLDPTHKGMMVELLQRATVMPVQQVTDRLRIEPDHVYVIPPNQDMTILHRTLHLLDMVNPRGLRLPIDFFFRSMADDLQSHTIGVILSGMGSDGTLGLRAIKEKGGWCFVQEPSSAKFDGMPRSALDNGFADVVAPVEDLPERIFSYLKHIAIISKPAPTLEDRALSSLEKIIILLRSQTRHDFSLYKKNTIYRRIERRMSIHQIEKISNYVKYLRETPHEIELLFKELLIGVTSFFRDSAAWDALKTQAIPKIIANHPSGGVLRAWTVGCSTGEEAYSLAIVFREVIETLKPPRNFKLQIFATDLDNDAIDKARTGLYPSNITADVSPERIKRYFEKDERGYRISRAIRETVVFAPHNVIMDPPFTKLDILVCRNLLIYMEQELQKKLIPLFHYSLNPGGILFLGSAETLGFNSNLFEAIDVKSRLFRQLHQGIRPEWLDFPSSFSTLPCIPDIAMPQEKSTTSETNMKAIIDQILIQQFAPAAVLTNEKGDIIYFSGQTGKYLEPAAGKANLNIFAMAREGIRYELNILFSNVLRQKGELTKKGLTIGTNGGKQIVNVTVKLLDNPESLKNLVMVIFTDVSMRRSSADKKHKQHTEGSDSMSLPLQEELKQAKDEILTIREEMQTSQEELKSANEELQSSNEEMQSTNEELTTSKEEMQSLNEELQTVNHELQSKVADLSQANNDMRNLLNSTEIATLFLDDELNIRRFTNRTITIFKLIETDIGRPITDIVTDLQYPDLSADAREVLRTLVFSEKQVSAIDGRWFTVRIMPYRTLENRINGLVMTFNEISVAKKLEQNLLVSQESFRFLIDSMPVGTIFLDSEGHIEMANREAERITGIPTAEMQGNSAAELRWNLVREDGSDFPLDEQPVFIASKTGKSVTGVIMGLLQEQGKSCQWLKVNAIPRLHDGSKTPYQVYMTFVEITVPVK